MDKREKKIKLIVSSAAMLITIICTIITFSTRLETGKYKLLGSYASIFVVTAALWGFPLKFYIIAMVFDVFSTSFGSIINLYRYTDYFDRSLHYLSGLLLCECGRIIIGYILKKRGLPQDFVVKLSFSAFFSIACAGLWEIYEFLSDVVLSIHMQGRGKDTMFDLICGTLGAVTYCALSVIAERRKVPKPTTVKNGESAVENY